MIREYLQMSEDNKDESEELERLASQLTLSETPQQVSEGSGSGWFDTTVTAFCFLSLQVNTVQTLLESFTALSIQKRQETWFCFYGSGGTINLYSEAHLCPLLVN